MVGSPQPGGRPFGAALRLPRESGLLAARGGGGAVGDRRPGSVSSVILPTSVVDRAAVGGGQAGLAPVDDHRGGDFAVLQRLGRVERVGRFGVAGQVGGRLVAFGVFELARQVGRAGGDEDRQEPDREDDPLRPTTGGEGEERAAHCVPHPLSEQVGQVSPRSVTGCLAGEVSQT